jgi:uncharacterized membrane protein YhaH (DUF805 family)
MTSIFVWYFLSLSGRISRREFSLGIFGFLAVCGLLTKLLTELSFLNSTGRIWNRDELAWALSLPFVIAFLILIWPLIAIAVKRLHDMNMSGWWLLLALTIPFIAGRIGVNSSTLVLMGYGILMSVRGTSGSNKFGVGPPEPSGT